MMTTNTFLDRMDAGQQLAQIIPDSIKNRDPVILALPRGGVPVAAEISRAWGVPLDILVVRKIGVPGVEETAMGAIAGTDIRVLDRNLITMLDLKHEEVEAAVERELCELRRRENLYRGNQPAPDLAGRTVIVVDDGIATGSKMIAAIALLRSQRVARIVVAAPVAAAVTADCLREKADDVIVVLEPDYFSAVGNWYEDFSETTDDQVISLLAEWKPEQHPSQELSIGNNKYNEYMKLAEIMTRDPDWIRPEASMEEAACKMRELDTGFILVGDGDRLQGIITDVKITIRVVVLDREKKLTDMIPLGEICVSCGNSKMIANNLNDISQSSILAY